MAYFIDCAAGELSVTQDSVSCNPSPLNNVGLLPDITPDTLGALLTLALTVWALAWGFRALGSLIYRQGQ